MYSVKKVDLGTGYDQWVVEVKEGSMVVFDTEEEAESLKESLLIGNHIDVESGKEMSPTEELLKLINEAYIGNGVNLEDLEVEMLKRLLVRARDYGTDGEAFMSMINSIKHLIDL